MISLYLPAGLAALLVGLGVYGMLARRNAVLVLVGVELVLAGASLLLVTAGSRPGSPYAAGPVLTVFVITIAAAEVVVALAVVLLLFRRTGSIDLTKAPATTPDADLEAVPPPGSRYSDAPESAGIPRTGGQGPEVAP